MDQREVQPYAEVDGKIGIFQRQFNGHKGLNRAGFAGGSNS